MLSLRVLQRAGNRARLALPGRVSVQNARFLSFGALRHCGFVYLADFPCFSHRRRGVRAPSRLSQVRVSVFFCLSHACTQKGVSARLFASKADDEGQWLAVS